MSNADHAVICFSSNFMKFILGKHRSFLKSASTEICYHSNWYHSNCYGNGNHNSLSLAAKLLSVNYKIHCGMTSTEFLILLSYCRLEHKNQISCLSFSFSSNITTGTSGNLRDGQILHVIGYSTCFIMTFFHYILLL